MKCPDCKTTNPDLRKFCRECGAKLLIICSQCDFENAPGDKFCGECGKDLKEPSMVSAIDYSQPQSYTPKHLADKILTSRSAIEGERKLVTVLFADVANYTAMSEKLDPEEVHQIMDGCFGVLMGKIHKYEGTINQFTGDGVMALFGAPIAHEDHAQRACRSALSIQKAISEYGEKIKKDTGISFRMRMGLNSGPVVVGSIGDNLRMDYTAVGDTTNLASRMESMARPGAILISEATHRLAASYFEFKSMGKVEVKGKKKPQGAFELIKPSKITTRLEASITRGLTRFVGRRNSMGRLMGAYEKMKTGSGQVIGIIGEAGVGKSRILLEFRNRISREQFSYHEGRCIQYGGGMPYIPILGVLRSSFGIKEDDSEFIIKKKINVKMTYLRMNLEESIPPVHDFLSLKVDDKDYINLEPEQKKNRILETIQDLLIRESQTNLLIIAIEDLHWIDKISEELLDYFIGRLANARILIVLLYRSEYTHHWGSKPYYNRIGLDQLTTLSSAELVEAILKGGEAAPEIRELILSRAAGNPLFMEEITHALIEEGSIQKKNNCYILSQKPSEIQVPDTVQGIIAARMDRLEENQKRIIQAASVIGREFSLRILQTITRTQEDLKSHLLYLQNLELIYEKSLFPELEYIFKHALTREVAYNSLLKKRRKEIHEKIGQALESLYTDRLEEHYELIAHHYGRSSNMDKALEYLDLANQKAVKLTAVEEAKAYFDDAMELLNALPENEANRKRRITLLTNQGFTFRHLIKYHEYYKLLTHYEPMAKGLNNPGLLGVFYSRMGSSEHHLGSTEQAIQTLSRAAELCESDKNYGEAVQAYAYLMWAHIAKDDYRRALVFRNDVLRMAERQFNPRWVMSGLTGASTAYTALGCWDKAVEAGQKALDVVKESMDGNVSSFPAWFLSYTYTQKGDHTLAVKYGKLAVQAATTPFHTAGAKKALGWALCRAGEINKGIELLTAVLSMQPDTMIKRFIAEGYWLAGDNDKAKQMLEEVLKEVKPSVKYKMSIGRTHHLLGEIALKDNPDQAASHFERSIALFQKIGAENDLALAYAGYGRFYKQNGNIKKAQEYLTKALEIFERLGTLIEPDRVREELAGLTAA